MRKFECKGCENHCVTTMKTVECSPSFCLYDTIKGNWHEVKEDNAENAQVDVKSEPLPNWVKVGAIGYDTHTNDYFEIVCINCTFGIVNVNLFNGGYLQHNYDIIRNHCVKAQKRPFNDKEMREIVGKSLETPGFVKFIFSYDKENKTLESYDFLYTADDLFEDDFKFEGKPCYKLEHLNNNGEWVE